VGLKGPLLILPERSAHKIRSNPIQSRPMRLLLSFPCLLRYPFQSYRQPSIADVRQHNPFTQPIQSSECRAYVYLEYLLIFRPGGQECCQHNCQDNMGGIRAGKTTGVALSPANYVTWRRLRRDVRQERYCNIPLLF
jgi:hypothetical protein